ncbi:MAG: hypothetical protein FJ343_05105 [Sphingomonadales bacterium]|nr:hypothetical protein [Sphingomonadales bacterium]
MNSTLRAVVVVLLICAGAMLTFLVERFEKEHPMASVRLLTPEQWAKQSARSMDRTLRSPALILNRDEYKASISETNPSLKIDFSIDSAPLLSDSLVGLLREIPVLPVDTLRWRLWKECCSFDLRYPVGLQFKVLLQTIAQKGGSEWTLVVPEVHFSTWQRILESNPIIEIYPKS